MSRRGGCRRFFISYRRSDSQMVAGRLRESLARRMGESAIFRDKNSIGAGEDWVRVIEESLTGNVLVLALIGPNWATARDETGAVNGLGNVFFYEGKFDEAIMHHERALNLAGGSYPAAEHDLNLVMQVKSGAVPFPE